MGDDWREDTGARDANAGAARAVRTFCERVAGDCSSPTTRSCSGRLPAAEPGWSSAPTRLALARPATPGKMWSPISNR